MWDDTGWDYGGGYDYGGDTYDYGSGDWGPEPDYYGYDDFNYEDPYGYDTQGDWFDPNDPSSYEGYDPNDPQWQDWGFNPSSNGNYNINFGNGWLDNIRRTLFGDRNSGGGQGGQGGGQGGQGGNRGAFGELERAIGGFYGNNPLMGTALNALIMRALDRQDTKDQIAAQKEMQQAQWARTDQLRNEKPRYSSNPVTTQSFSPLDPRNYGRAGGEQVLYQQSNPWAGSQGQAPVAPPNVGQPQPSPSQPPLSQLVPQGPGGAQPEPMALTSPGTMGGFDPSDRMYAGGTPYFNESTGEWTGPPRTGPGYKLNAFNDTPPPTMPPDIGIPMTGPLSTLRAGNMMQSRTAPEMYAQGGDVQGPGGGQDDLIPAKLSDGEYVMDAETVSALGDGSTQAGFKKLDKMRQNVRKHKRGASHKTIAPKAKDPLSYLKG